MNEEVRLVPYRGEQVYEDIFARLDQMETGDQAVLDDPAPHRKALFSTRIHRGLKWRNRPYRVRTRTTEDGRLLVTKVGLGDTL